MKEYSLEEVYQNTLTYFEGDELAAQVWIDKYALKNKNGDFLELTPKDMHLRLAKSFAAAEGKYNSSIKEGLSEYGQERSPLTEDKIFELFHRFKYLIPQGSVMANLGNPFQLASLSNCVVLPEIHDSYGGIMHTDEQLAQMCKRRCGVGIDISSLRPASSQVSNAAVTSSGATSFMHRFSNTTREVAQNGRRGALMLTIDIRHTDVLDFIQSKSDLTKITGANISVKINNAFMQAVEFDQLFELKWPINSDNPSIIKQVRAKELWDVIIENAHQSAEPGVIFWDRQHHYSTSSIYPEFKNLTTNPCSEIAMQGGDSCRLMAINLTAFIKEPFQKEAKFDFDHFYKVTYEAMYLMDDLVDLEIESIDNILEKINTDPEPDFIKATEKEIWEILKKNGEAGRRTGLGFTGLADTLAMLNTKYDSDDALLLSDSIMRFKLMAEFDASIDMAITRGSFKAYDPRVEWDSSFIKMMAVDFPEIHNRMEKYGRRNISISTVAPTGSVSILTQTSSGIEPVYQLEYSRKKKVSQSSETSTQDAIGDYWETYQIIHPQLKKFRALFPDAKEHPYKGCTAPEIDPFKRVELQSVIQKFTTHSISSTINLDATATKSTISDIYISAWKKGLKGITVYRDGSRDGVLVSTENKTATEEHCANCNSKNIIRQEACLKCQDCGATYCD